MIASLVLTVLSLSAPSCAPASGNARAELQRAAESVGLPRVAGRVLHLTGSDVTTHDFESDRMYPPFLVSLNGFDSWFWPGNGVERSTTRTIIAGYNFAGGTSAGSSTASYAVRDTGLAPSEALHGALYA